MESYYITGVLALTSHNYRDALKMLTICLKSRKNKSMVSVGVVEEKIAEKYYQLQDYERAVEHYEKPIE